MGPISAWFENNGDLVQLVYGLSIAAIGAAVIFQPKKQSRFPLARILWLFAGYALLHAPADLINMRSLSVGVPPAMRMLAIMLTFASYLCLFEFGRRLVSLSRRGPKAWLLPLIVGYIFVLSLVSAEPLRTADVLFGYLIRLPAGVMAGLGMYWFYYEREDELEPMDVKRYFMGIGVALLAWAFFCGAVRTDAAFFPANLLNKASFFDLVTIPVYVFRTACAVVCVWGVSGVLQIFNHETLNELARHREQLEDQVVLRTAELNQKHQTLSLLNQLLGMSMADDSLKTLLEHSLAAITKAPWLGIESKACVLLHNEERERFELSATTGAARLQGGDCRPVGPGQCGCCESANVGTFEVGGRSNGGGSRRFQEIHEHGHYCFPITHGGDLLGVLSITLPNNCQPEPKEREVLNSIAKVLASVIWRHNAGRALRRTELAYQEQLRGLASSLALAEEAERRQIAVGLHDQIGQNLALAKMKLSAASVDLSRGDESPNLDEVHKLLERVIVDTRSLTFELSPPILYELGFEAGVEWLVDRARERHGLDTTFVDDCHPKPLIQDVSILVFRAIRELLFNIVKHARARQVEVALARTRNHLRVEVFDDGVGFDVAALDPSTGADGTFGLFSIRERMRQIGGRFTLESSPGHGTVATLLAPLDRATLEEEDLPGSIESTSLPDSTLI